MDNIKVYIFLKDWKYNSAVEMSKGDYVKITKDNIVFGHVKDTYEFIANNRNIEERFWFGDFLGEAEMLVNEGILMPLKTKIELCNCKHKVRRLDEWQA